MSLLHAILLAIVEGITEFLPVSSTGHLIIAASWIGVAADPFSKTFIVAIQLGAILSVVVLYWKRFFQSLDFYGKLFVAFLPAAILGLLFRHSIDALLGRVDVVGFMLILGGIVLIFIDNFFKTPETPADKPVTYPMAVKIGLFQSLAVLAPGVSRSAATIIGGLTQGLTRKAAAEFSFLLAVPTMFAATGYKLFSFYKEAGGFHGNEVKLLLAGNAVAFVVALIAIRSFIAFLTRHGFRLFGYYRICFGIIILLLYYFGAELSII